MPDAAARRSIWFARFAAGAGRPKSPAGGPRVRGRRWEGQVGMSDGWDGGTFVGRW